VAAASGQRRFPIGTFEAWNPKESGREKTLICSLLQINSSLHDSSFFSLHVGREKRAEMCEKFS